MIRDDADLEESLKQVARLRRGLQALKEELAAKPNAYALMAEGPLDALRMLGADLEAHRESAQAREEATRIWARIVADDVTLGDAHGPFDDVDNLDPGRPHEDSGA